MYSFVYSYIQLSVHPFSFLVLNYQDAGSSVSLPVRLCSVLLFYFISKRFNLFHFLFINYLYLYPLLGTLVIIPCSTFRFNVFGSYTPAHPFYPLLLFFLPFINLILSYNVFDR